MPNWIGPLTYDDCLGLMNTPYRLRNGVIIGNNTRLHKSVEGCAFDVRLHGNLIMRINASGWEVFSGGWYSVTTKARLNRYLPRHVNVRQKNWCWNWEVYTGGEWVKVAPFSEGNFVAPDWMNNVDGAGQIHKSLEGFVRKRMPEVLQEVLA